MTAIPPPTRYHRWLGWHAPALRRTVIVGASGLIVAAALLWLVPLGVAVVTGWDVAALAFLVSVWPIIIRPTAGAPSSWPNAKTRTAAPRQRCCSARVLPASSVSASPSLLRGERAARFRCCSSASRC